MFWIICPQVTSWITSYASTYIQHFSHTKFIYLLRIQRKLNFVCFSPKLYVIVTTFAGLHVEPMYFFSTHYQHNPTCKMTLAYLLLYMHADFIRMYKFLQNNEKKSKFCTSLRLVAKCIYDI